MKHTILASVLALFGVMAVGACAGGEEDSVEPTPTSSCDALRACCAEMGADTEQTCLELIDAQQSSGNVEAWCQATLDSYQQAGVCGGGGGGSGGTAGSGGTGGSGGSSGTAGSGGGTAGSGGTSGTGGSGGGSGGGSTCVHDECTTGDPLDPSCSSCAATVCADDPFCCENSWNSFCVEGAQNLCGLCGGTGGTGGGSGSCAHDECTTGDALDPSCSSCVATVCADDPYCCDNSWNSYCVEGAQNLCGLCGGTGGTGGGSGSCSHDECTTGDALDPSCSSCVATVCADDPYCCNNSWNSYCVDGAKSLCGMCQ